MFHELLEALQETLFMVFVSGILTVALGLPLGILLSMTREGQLLEQPFTNRLIGFLVNITRSIPYVVLMVAVIPFTRWIIGKSEGSIAACVSLTLAAIPFYARQAEMAILTIPKGLLEAAVSFGATPSQVIAKVVIPEALPGLLQGVTSTLINLVGYSAMAGALAGGGLGSLAIHKGYHAFQPTYVLGAVVILIILVQIIQACGDYIAFGTFKKQ